SPEHHASSSRENADHAQTAPHLHRGAPCTRRCIRLSLRLPLSRIATCLYLGTLTRRFAAPSPRGRGTFCRRVLLPLGAGAAKRRMRALVCGFAALCLWVPTADKQRSIP